MKITFSTFETEIKYDYLEIRDGDTRWSRLLAEYSGTKSTFSFVSSGTMLWIYFYTNFAQLETRRGFRASYHALTPPKSSEFIMEITYISIYSVESKY